jgi:RND family efflux transporter MFP subunit
MRSRSVLLAGVLVPLSMIALAGCNDSAAETNDAAADAIAMARGEVEVEGGLVRISAATDGIIETLPVKDGEHVAAGDVLATLDHAAASLALDSARAAQDAAAATLRRLEAQLGYGKRQAARLEQALAEDAASPQALDEAQATVAATTAEIASARSALDSAQAAVRTAELTLSLRTLRAPIPGRLATRSLAACRGCAVHTDTALFVLIPDAPIVVRARIDEDFVDRVQPGMLAEVVPDSNPDQRYSAQVVRVGTLLRAADGDAPPERADVRTLDCELSIGASRLIVGQRVLVRFLRRPSA